MLRYVLKSLLLSLVFILFLISPADAGEKKNKIGIIVGQWQPNLLRDEEPSSVFQGTANSSPYWGVNYDYQLWSEISFHFSIGNWAHLFQEEDGDLTLVITPIELGIEHELISNSILSPYVLYGGGILLGDEIEGDKPGILNFGKFSNTGIDLFLLTGLRFAPAKSFDIDLSFGYIYAKFPNKIGTLDDYSGVRATFGVSYLF